MSDRKYTNRNDRFGNPIYEGDLVKSWFLDECEEINGGYWIFEIVKFYKSDWYLFCEGHVYEDEHEDDLPVLLDEHLHEIEVVFSQN